MRTFLIIILLLAVLAVGALYFMGAPLQMPAEKAGPPPATAPSPNVGSTGPVATPVVVEIDRTQPRRPANGGSSVVLFTDSPATADRNMVACLNIWNSMDQATAEEIQIGLRKAENGTVEALRPLYWLNRTALPAGEHSCSELMAAYDYPRAATLRAKYGLSGAGPHFVVARADEQAAAVIDLTGKTDREIADLTRYFRDGFAYQNDIWDPARNVPENRRALLTGFFGARFRESFVASLTLVTNPAARAGCALGDLADAPCT